MVSNGFIIDYKSNYLLYFYEFFPIFNIIFIDKSFDFIKSLKFSSISDQFYNLINFIQIIIRIINEFI